MTAVQAPYLFALCADSSRIRNHSIEVRPIPDSSNRIQRVEAQCPGPWAQGPWHFASSPWIGSELSRMGLTSMEWFWILGESTLKSTLKSHATIKVPCYSHSPMLLRANPIVSATREYIVSATQGYTASATQEYSLGYPGIYSLGYPEIYSLGYPVIYSLGYPVIRIGTHICIFSCLC